MRRQVEKSKRALMELKHGVFFNKSSVSFDSIQMSTSTINDTNLNNEGKQQQFINKYEYQLRCKKLDLIAINISQAEVTYYRLQAQFDSELSLLWKNHRNLVKDQGMITSLISLLEKRLTNITNRWRDIYNYRIDYFLQNAYDELDHMNQDEITQYVKIMSSSSSIIIDVQHPFNDKQLQLLSRGPSYVPSCLMYTSLSNESMGDIVKKQYAPLKHQLNNLFLKYKVNLNLHMEIHKKLYDLFKDLFSKSIPSSLSQRALYEKKLIESIRISLKKHNIILRRTADNMNIFYMGNKEEFEKKADRYLLTSEDYDVLFDVNDINNEKPFTLAMKDMIESINALLEQLKIHKAINNDLYKQFIVDTTHVKIPYLYFLPNLSNKLDLIALHLPQAEVTYYRLQAQFDSELSLMWKNHRNFVKDRGMTTSLISLLEKRLTNITNRWRDIYNYRIDYFLQNAYDELDHMNQDEITQYVKIMPSSSSIIIDVQHPFNDKQLQLLSRGPSYVPPCLIYTSLSNESMVDIVKKQYAPLKHQLNNLFLKYKINLNLQMEIHKKVYDLFKDLFSKSIPSSLSQRALYEKKLIESIRTSLKKHNIILRRTADNMNIFYMGNKEEFEKKADRYLLTCEDYDVLFDVNDTNNEKPFNLAIKDMIESINALLEQLKIHKGITDDLYKQFIVNPTRLKIPYLYFLPNLSNENVLSLVPIVTSQYSTTWKMAKYLNKLLRPYADGVLRSTSFTDETDFIRKLYRYAIIERRLRPSTLFCTIKITNFCTLEEHKEMIDVIGYFLQDNLATNKLETLTIQTIRNLLHLFLHNNIFSYKNSIYKFTKGSPNTIPLTETLSNIYLFVWQKKILKEVNQNIELFGRYKDRIFFTWNKSTAIALETFLEDLREKHRNVRFQKLIGTSVSFLNAYIENRQGQLYTRTHYDPNMPRYTLPYVTGHTKSSYSDWLFFALIRAICYCTLVDDFQQERVYLELTYLINGYSVLFVETHVKRFFNHFSSETMRFSYNQNSYDQFRQQWFKFIEQRHELSQQLQKLDDTNCLFQFHYIYDFGPKCRFNRDFRQLWHQYFQQHPTLSEENCKIILNAKNFHSLNTLLGMDKPALTLGQ
ncbi:unnamed protein product [Rotaria sp. Silwood1]|nr:unnamed protein product [Rotaria sp. Silwood1]